MLAIDEVNDTAVSSPRETDDQHDNREKKRPKSKRLVRRKNQLPPSLKPVTAMVLFAKANGKLYPKTRFVGFSLNEILINCTQIMKLSLPARKIYSNDGKLIESLSELRPFDEIFVSVGEPFIDPIKLIKESINIKAGSFWGLNGVYIPKTKRKAKSAGPKLGGTGKMWRILTFSNREYFVDEAIEIISDLKDIEEAKEICSMKHNFNGRCKRLFTVNNDELFDLTTLRNEESFVWNPNSNIKVLGPIWATKCEDLNQQGVNNYFNNTRKSIENMLNASKNYLSELEAIDNGDFDSYPASKAKSFSKPELKIRQAETEKKIRNLDSTFKKFDCQIQILPEPSSQTITETDKSVEKSTFSSSKGLRLKAYQNGQDSNHKFTVFFNVLQAKRGVNDSKIVFNRFLDCLSENFALSKVNDFSKGILVRRVFTDCGDEIKNVAELSYDQVVCVSHGEDWIDPTSMCLCAKIHLMNKELEWTMFDLEINSKSLKGFQISNKCDETFNNYSLPVLQHKKKSHIFMMPSIFVSDRKEKDENSLTLWTYTVNGRLILKQLPSMCLTIVPSHLKSMSVNKYSLKPQKSESERREMIDIYYYNVHLYPIRAHDSNQMWNFNKSGQLFNKASPGFFLTYLENVKRSTNDDFFDNAINSNIVAAENLPDDLQMYQRWGFKQESFKNLDQWKMCDLPNPEWHKAALTWPLKHQGNLNDELIWPIEGVLLPCVPPLTARKYDLDTRFPIKLMVLKNNDHAMKTPVLVTGPDLTKLIKKGKNDSKELHCLDESLFELEFKMFLDFCTGTLCLPSAARRIFDQYGDELIILQGLSKNDLVYVSTGDMWCSPDKALSKIELRSYANKLIVDIERLKYFISLHQPNDEFVVGVKNDNLEEGVSVEIQVFNEQTKWKLHKLFKEDNDISTPEPVKEPSIDESLKPKTFHEKHCDAARRRLNNQSTVDIDLEQSQVLDKTKKVDASATHFNAQQFIYQNSKILLLDNQKFCLSGEDVGKPLIVQKLGFSNDNRCNWIIHKSGMIESMQYRGYVISVHCPKMLPFQDKALGDYRGCVLILDKAINTKYGKAHQIFKIDTRSGLFCPFFTNAMDKSVTAALLAGICTSYVCSKSMSQPGSLVDINREHKPTCSSCIGVLNGRYPISPLDENLKKFQCTSSGGFKVIKRHIDLSPIKAEEKYQYFVKKLEDIRQQLTVKVCKTRLTSLGPQNILVLLNLNNNPRLLPPQRVTGKSIDQIMQLATGIFNLQRPVRILFTIKGEEIVDDLSFRNVMSRKEDNKPQGMILDKENSVLSKEVPIAEKNDENKNSNFNISLSEDQRFFVIEFDDKLPECLYTLQINISSINGIGIFNALHVHQDSAFLFNYEIFNNQINTELFFGDSDFEGEQTELSIKSSPMALRHLFANAMPTLRIQLISAKVSKNQNENSEFQVDIESIDAIVDFSFDGLLGKLQVEPFESYSDTLNGYLLSTETFTATPASLIIELSLNKISDLISKQTDEILSVETMSVINVPSYQFSSTPIQLWASIGESFISPHKESKPTKKEGKNIDLIQQLKSEIDQKKFLLRTIKGERFKKLNSGTLEGTPSQTNPVKIKGNWQFPTSDEIKLEEEIESLQKQLNDVKLPTGTGTLKPNALSRELYKQKHLKNCFIHLNGERENSAISVWGETIFEIMQNAAQSLGMKKKPKYLFNIEGQEVTKMEEISPGDVLSVSHQSTYLSSRDSELQCEIKANWGRARRQYGEDSTELKIQYRPNTVIDIDPFEPPEIMKHTQDIPSKVPKAIKVFENGQPISGAKSIIGHSLSELLKRATDVLDLSLPIKCFYTQGGRRITGFKEILHDDILAASVSGKGLLKIKDN